METAAAAPAARSNTALGDLKEELHELKEELHKVERDIDALSEKIEAGEQAFEAGTSFRGLDGERLLTLLDSMRKEKQQLREKEKQLREEKAKVLDMQQQRLSHSERGDIQLLLQKIYDAVTSKPAGPRTISISKANSTVWREVTQNAELGKLCSAEDLHFTPRSKHVPPFLWGQGTEVSHASAYLEYLEACLKNPIGRLGARCVLLNGNGWPLDADGLGDVLGYRFRGKTDVLVVERNFILTPLIGLRVLFEVKRNRSLFNTYQAMATLLLANWHSNELRPIVILTDLGENYQFYWMDGRKVYTCYLATATTAWGLLDAILEGDETLSSAPSEGAQTKRGTEMVFSVAKRQRLVLGEPNTGAGSCDVADLADLEGFLDPAEIRACQMAQLLGQLRATPALQSARKAYEAMYS